MYVGSIMHRDIISVGLETSLSEAMELTKVHRIRHLIVIDSRKNLAGIVSSHDINQTLASPATSLSTHELNYLIDQVKVESFMKRNVITVNPGTTVERAAYIMQKNKISALPVIKENRIVGIVTSSDVMGVLLDAIGMSDDTMRLVVYMGNRIGAMAEVTAVMRDNGINIQSLFTWPDKDKRDLVHVVIRVSKNDGEMAKDSLVNAGYEVITSYRD
jgi:acetoin utilization protein AcuB